MGTIAQKLEYLNDTRLLLKDNINKINNVLDDNSTFRSYPQELFNGYLDILNNGTDTLWNNLEKVSASGEEATLENVETAPMKMVLNGNTSQETTSGKNILPIQDDVADLNGVTLTIENGILTLNGTTSASGSFKLTNGIDTQNGGIPNANWLQEEAIENLNGKVLSFQNISGVAPTSSWAVRLFDNTTTYTRQYTYSQLSGDKLFDTDIRLGVMTIYLNANLTFNNFKIAIQIENGTSSTDFEKYTGGQPSPSPDYPQQVKVVTGENVVSVQGKNLFDKNITLHSGWYNDNGVFQSSTGTSHTEEKYKVKPNETYTLSGNAIAYDTTYVFARIYYYDKDKNWISRGAIAQPTYSFVIPSNCYYIDFQISIGSSYVDDWNRVTTNSQLEENSQATPYVPYSKTDYPINLNANMFDPTQIPDNNFGKRLSTTGDLYGDIDYFVSDWIPIQPNTEYEVNWTPEAKKRICFYSSFLTSSFISYNDTENIFKTPNNATYMRFSNLTSEASNLSVKLKNSLELCKINTYKDYFHKDSDKWYVHKEFDKIILNENSYWYERNVTISGVSRKIFFSRSDKFKSYVSMQNMLCNYFKVKNTYGTSPTANNQFYNNYERTNNLEFAKFEFTTLTEWKEWVASHNIILVGKLATPTDTEITNTNLIEQLEAISKTKSVKDKTYITQTNDELPFILDVEAIKEYEVN